MTHRKHPGLSGGRAVQLVLSLALVLMVGGYFALTKLSGCTYTITDGDQVTQITTGSAGTDRVLQEAGISLNEGDKVSVTGGSARENHYHFPWAEYHGKQCRSIHQHRNLRRHHRSAA